MISRNLPIQLLSLALLAALPACDSGGSDDDDNNKNQLNTYTATVTGHTTASMSGRATATGAAAFGGWGLALGLTGLENSITLVVSGRDRPPEGAYDIIRANQGSGQPNVYEFSGSVILGGGLESYTTRGGTLTLTTSTSTRVEGTFTITAERFVGQIITVTGSFNASNTGS